MKVAAYTRRVGIPNREVTRMKKRNRIGIVVAGIALVTTVALAALGTHTNPKSVPLTDQTLGQVQAQLTASAKREAAATAENLKLKAIHQKDSALLATAAKNYSVQAGTVELWRNRALGINQPYPWRVLLLGGVLGLLLGVLGLLGGLAIAHWRINPPGRRPVAKRTPSPMR